MLARRLYVERRARAAGVAFAYGVVGVVLQYLRPRHYVGRHVIDGRALRAAGEHVAPVDEQRAYAAALVCYVAVVAYVHAGQAPEHVGNVVLGAGLEVVGVEPYGVARNLNARIRAFHNKLSQCLAVGLQLYVYAAFAGRYALYAVGIAEALNLKPRRAVYRKAEATVAAGNGVALHRRRKQAVGVCQDRGRHYRSALGIGHTPAHHGLLGRGGDCETAASGKRQQQSFNGCADHGRGVSHTMPWLFYLGYLVGLIH